jgi:2-polyprenyl-6-methoxyphenol hydroxylase-like FAD-dependent oxidoreductase
MPMSVSPRQQRFWHGGVTAPLDQYQLRRCLSTPASPSPLRVAVVGAGVAGCSVALHLAPLVKQGSVARVDLYDDDSNGSGSKNDIGVGIWTTGLDPFQERRCPSHEFVYNQIAHYHGTWLQNVGYRTPAGAWLMQSSLPTSRKEMEAMNMPGLLFLRQGDLLETLRRAVQMEDAICVVPQRVVGIQEQDNPWSAHEQQLDRWSARLELDSRRPDDNHYSDRDYHLIVACDGTHSTLRLRYAGFYQRRPAATTPLGNQAHLDSIGLQNRGYTVFRGNAHCAALDWPESFQTWGEGRNMRFATVPMNYRRTAADSLAQPEQRQVWFITLENDADFTAQVAAMDPVTRRNKLLEIFGDWHPSVRQIVEATPPQDILVDEAVAHRHVTNPVLQLPQSASSSQRHGGSMDGPCLVFVGDSYMTVDPILAQGFTMAMEGAYSLAQSVESVTRSPHDDDTPWTFDPMHLRQVLQQRHEERITRLICLLRATELVQMLGQPVSTGLLGWLNINVLRPVLQLIPNAVKKPLFDGVLRYSLGLPQSLFQKSKQ